MTLRLYYASDIHGSEVCWRKFLNGASFYHADVIVMGGDLAGKALVPIIAEANGIWRARFLGKEELLSNEQQLLDLERAIRTNGMYPHRTRADEVARIGASKAELSHLFERVMVDEARRWVKIADEKLASMNGVRAFVMAGNDDPFALDQPLSESRHFELCDGRIVQFGDYEMISVAYSNRTPWNSPRELDEEKLYARIEELANQLTNPRRSIFNLHVPPYGSGLDDAPLLDEKLTPKLAAGSIQTGPVGSHAVRKAIEKYQPLLALHGHVHESRGVARIGRTVAINPGSDYASGLVHGCLVTLDGDRVKTHQFVAG
jgi:Icc-related predicted phosphoesterase